MSVLTFDIWIFKRHTSLSYHFVLTVIVIKKLLIYWHT